MHTPCTHYAHITMHMPCTYLQQVGTEADEVGPGDYTVAPRAAAARSGQVEGCSGRRELSEELHRIHLVSACGPAPRSAAAATATTADAAAAAAAPGGFAAASVDSKHRGSMPRPRHR